MPPIPVRVLIVDDSLSVRTILKRILSPDPRIEVVDLAHDGIDAIQKIKKHRPDVVTLDVEMPRLNGIGVLERVAGKVPISFVMVSSLTEAGGRVTVEALRLGAFDYVTKPQADTVSALPAFRERLVKLVIAAAKAKGRTRRICGRNTSSTPTLPPCKERGWLVAIGISCGGPPTLFQMLPAFPSDFPPIVLTQHMPSPFTATFASGLNHACAVKVVEVSERMKIQRGMVYIAKGGTHLKVVRQGIQVHVQPFEGPEVSGHRPSADYMFDTVARAMQARSIGVVMTGMGEDGSKGIRRMKAMGARIIAQDEESSIVYGMPSAAAKTGCVDQVVPLEKIPQTILKLMTQSSRTATPATA